MKDIGFIYNKIISKFGQEIIRKPRIETKSGETVEYSYGEQELIKGQATQIVGYREVWERPGIVIEGDYLVTFPRDTIIEIGDLIYVNNEWLEIVDKIVRRYGNNVSFIETLCRRTKL
jgi:hypothetical protein